MIIPFLLFFISMNVTYAYFTATATEKKSTATTAVIRVGFDSSTTTEINSNVLTSHVDNIFYPGDVLSAQGKIENSGKSNIYAILVFKVLVTKKGETEAQTAIEKYYSFDGSGNQVEIVVSNNSFSNNACLIEAPNANKTNNYTRSFSVSYEFVGADYDDDYQEASVEYLIAAYAVQTTNLEGTGTQAENATEILMERFVKGN